MFVGNLCHQLRVGKKLASGDGGGGASEQVMQRRVEARGWRWLPFSIGLGKTIFSSEPLDSN